MDWLIWGVRAIDMNTTETSPNTNHKVIVLKQLIVFTGFVFSRNCLCFHNIFNKFINNHKYLTVGNTRGKFLKQHPELIQER